VALDTKQLSDKVRREIRIKLCMTCSSFSVQLHVHFYFVQKFSYNKMLKLENSFWLVPFNVHYTVMVMALIRAQIIFSLPSIF
jgi:hypothetical protein